MLSLSKSFIFVLFILQGTGESETNRPTFAKNVKQFHFNGAESYGTRQTKKNIILPLFGSDEYAGVDFTRFIYLVRKYRRAEMQCFFVFGHIFLMTRTVYALRVSIIFLI